MHKTASGAMRPTCVYAKRSSQLEQMLGISKHTNQNFTTKDELKLNGANSYNAYGRFLRLKMI